MNCMITISFKTYGTNCLYKFVIMFQCNKNGTFKINKNYISVVATISLVEMLFKSMEQNSGTEYVRLLIVNEMKAENKS